MSSYDSISSQLDDAGEARSSGADKIAWARSHMPILAAIRERVENERPLEGWTVGMAMHVEAKTAVLTETLAAAGASVAITGCNPLSTHDDVSAALDAVDGVTCYAKRGVDESEYYAAIDAVIEAGPEVTIDDGGDLVFRLHEHYPERLSDVIGGCEETTTGVHRLRAMAADGALEYPMIAVNDTPMKQLFDNIHGTGESSLASIAMTTNLSWAGSTVVVAGYGHCGKGVAKKAAGQNARVIVTEVEPRRALEAHMEGFEVMPMVDAAAEGDLFLTTTGNRDVITLDVFREMQDGAVLANAGHFDIEIDLEGLAEYAVDSRAVRDGITAYRLPDGREVNVLAEGRLVNLATPVALGHAIEVMDQSFGVQAACAEELVANHGSYESGVHPVPDELDRHIAEIKLAAEGIEHDELSPTQREYLDRWDHGT